MRRIEDAGCFSLRNVNPVAPNSTEVLGREQIAAAHAMSWPLEVAVTPVIISFPEAEPEWLGPVVIENIEETELGARGLRGVLTVTSFFPDTLSKGMADPSDTNDVMAQVDLIVNGLVPTLGLRGILLGVTTKAGNPIFQEIPTDYDPGRYRQAGRPPVHSPDKL